MATRRKTNRRRRTTGATPNRRRRRNPVVVVRRNRRRANMRVTRRRRSNRRRNPNFKTLIQGGLYAAAGGMAFSVVSGFIPIQASGLAGIGVQLGVAYLTAMIGERLLPGGSQFFAAGAAAGVGVNIINYALGLVSGPLTGALAGGNAVKVGDQPAQVAAPPPGMADIAIYDDIGLSGLSDVAVYEAPYS